MRCVLALTLVCAVTTTSSAQSFAERPASEATRLREIEQAALQSESDTDAEDEDDVYGEVIASSRGGEALPDLDAPPLARRVSRNIGRGYAGALAGFAATQIFCAFSALRNSNVDWGELATWCGALGAAVGFGVTTPLAFRGKGRLWAGLPGSILGTGLGFGLALAPNIPWGVGAVALAIVPVALSVLGYQLSDRRQRRRQRRFRFGEQRRFRFG